MITISISAEAYQAITGHLPDPSQHDAQGGFAITLDRKTIDRLTAMRAPGESYSDAILRVASAEASGGLSPLRRERR